MNLQQSDQNSNCVIRRGNVYLSNACARKQPLELNISTVRTTVLKNPVGASGCSLKPFSPQFHLSKNKLREYSLLLFITNTMNSLLQQYCSYLLLQNYVRFPTSMQRRCGLQSRVISCIQHCSGVGIFVKRGQWQNLTMWYLFQLETMKLRKPAALCDQHQSYKNWRSVLLRKAIANSECFEQSPPGTNKHSNKHVVPNNEVRTLKYKSTLGLKW